MGLVRWMVVLLCVLFIPISNVQAQSQDWDVQPFIDIQSKRTMVPVRFISEALGAEVKWDAQTRIVTLEASGKSIRLKIGDHQAWVNEKQEMLDSKAIIRNDRTFVPLRFISETFGAKVDWIGTENKVVVKTEKKTIEMVIRQWEATMAGQVIGQIDPHSIEVETSEGTKVIQLSSDVMKQMPTWREGAIIFFKSYKDSHNRQIMTELIQRILPESLSEKEKNDRFSHVHVLQYEGQYWVMGKARVFEAVLGYVVEDGHYELAEGFANASQGAPGWGFFLFSLDVKKVNPNSTLMLILFESSPKDGSRQHQLFKVLP
ncbi:stalk domain-containing protein [Ammoniphilus sp. YIM 78166]|uniref:stalk domain-containing protein n=1 Tax=Ammoniphilus sp. YIM 78166 TaxID=1644106 RepID=UPI00106F890D|nr:stalk domain-containing protein [Ammoniphilus sp. YIM 78166]